MACRGTWVEGSLKLRHTNVAEYSNMSRHPTLPQTMVIASLISKFWACRLATCSTATQR
jgi:hypothetical protein